MINITLPDGTKKQYDQPLDGLKIAESIDNSCIDVVSIEDAHCHNNLEELLRI